MKIKISYKKIPKLMRIPALLKVPHKRIISDFVIDTGSPYTILNYSDSIRLNIPHTTKGEIIRIGGRTYQSYIFNKFEIILKTMDDKEITEIIPIRVLKPTSLKIDELRILDNLPNILGLDFLEKGYKLVCNIPEYDIYLEKDIEAGAKIR